jgi:hypothetical protein
MHTQINTSEHVCIHTKPAYAHERKIHGAQLEVFLFSSECNNLYTHLHKDLSSDMMLADIFVNSQSIRWFLHVRETGRASCTFDKTHTIPNYKHDMMCQDMRWRRHDELGGRWRCRRSGTARGRWRCRRSGTARGRWRCRRSGTARGSHLLDLVASSCRDGPGLPKLLRERTPQQDMLSMTRT